MITERLRNARILIVEDEAIIAMDLEGTLAELEAVVVGPAFTLSAAKALASGESLAAAILDVRLGTDSIDPVAAVLAARGVPFLFHTGHEQTATLKAAWPRCQVITKPSTREQLAEGLATLLGSRIAINGATPL
jgi:DNA-binding NtrC family response regulator